MDQDETWHAGRPRSRPHCARWGPSSSRRRGTTPEFSAHVCCGQTAGWIKMPLATEVALGPGHIVLDVDPVPKGHSPQFSAHVCCGQTAGFIKMPLRTEIGLGPRPHCVRWGPSPSKKGHTPNFGPCLFWPNGWMDQDATWYGGRPQPSRHCVRWGASSPYQGVLHPHFSAHVYAKRLDGSRCHLVRIDLIPRPRCIRLGLGTHLSP